MKCNESSNAVVEMDTRIIVEPKLIKRDSYLNVKSFLSSHTPLGLVCNNSCKEEEDTHGIVDFDILDGKVVMICCFSLPLPTTDSAIAMAMSYVSSELHAFGAFELVIVLNMRRDVNNHSDDVSVFNDFISALPSFALLVPYLNSNSDEICHFLNFVPGSDPVGVLVNRNHMVEWRKSLSFFLQYGADAYPFTTERLSVITEMEMQIIPGEDFSSPSFYLCSHILPYPKYASIICKNPGGGPGKQCIADFDDRSIVGLYLCYTGNLIPTLAEVHKNCSDKGLELDIILVYMPFKDYSDPKSFQERINSALEERKASCWVFPFVYWVSRRLSRLFHGETEDRLIMIDNINKLVEPHAEVVVRHFGIGAYPFFRSPLLERELEKLRGLTLESLLVHNSRDFVLRWNDDKVPVKALRGKNVLVYLSKTTSLLQQWYFDSVVEYFFARRKCDPYFEMVFVGFDARPGYLRGLLLKSSLVCPFEPEHFEFVSKKIFRESGIENTVLAFGKDGYIRSVRAQEFLSSSSSPSPSSPNFMADNLRTEMIRELFGYCKLPVCCLSPSP